ncbi:MAG TPA: glycosyltransferase [Planctomycetota bacterium]|nr:glycosyltransferase [Planctomycetota bacterium]
MSSELSILIAGRNTLRFLPLCLRSIRENLTGKDHVVTVLDDASTDGSREWLEANRSRYGYELELHQGPERLGIVGAYNRLVADARTPVVWLVHSDMYFAKAADVETARYLEPGTVCTCTRIEPPIFGPAAFKIVRDCGLEPEEFRERDFLEFAEGQTRPGHFTEGIFAPVMCYRDDFLAVGGLDPAFAPQSREDSDLFNRMALAGYRFRQSWSAFCYHFAGRGSRKKDGVAGDSSEWQATNSKNERNFIRRWGCSVRHDHGLKPIVPRREPIALVALLGREAEHVVPFLDHLEPFFDEVVFVADGPQPECVAAVDAYSSKEIAAGPTLFDRKKIRVFERPLAGDFAAQRNFGQEQCASGWVLHVDLDERLDRGLLESLQDILLDMRRGGKSVCGFPRLNFLDGVLVNDLAREEWTPEGLERARGKPPDQVRSLDPQFRLLRRDVRWKRPVHETPETLERDPRAVTIWSHAFIRHPKTLARQKQQDARYESIRPGAGLRPAAGRQAGNAGHLRLLMLATEYPPARGYGLGRYASELAEALAATGAEVHVVTQNYDSGKPLIQANGVSVHLVTERKELDHYRWVSNAVLDNLWLVERALEVMRDHGPFDVLLTHDWLGALAAKSLKASQGLPWVFFMHDTEPGKRGNKLDPEQIYIAEMEAWACANANAVVANSRFTASELTRYYQFPADKLAVVPCGVNPRRFHAHCHLPDFRALLAAPDEKLLLYVGRLSPMKGVDVLVEAMPQILAQRPATRLAIAGEGVLKDEILKTAKSKGLEGRVRLLGHLSGPVLAAAYRAASLIVVPSRYEPFGMVALEAMCCGTPVAAADTGGLKEVVPADGLTRRFAADNAKALAASVIEALGRSMTGEDRQRLQDHASRFSWERSADETIGLCRQVLAGSAGKTP